MLDRLVGLETEYAIRFSRDGGGPDSGPPANGAGRTKTPGNHRLFQALARSIGKIVETATASGVFAAKEGFFTANGGGFNYEHLPHALDGGLIEGATPECRGPSQVLLYQKAQDALLVSALPAASAEIRAERPGHIGLLKNCRDAEGHVYGAQENYEYEIASGLPLLIYRLGLLVLVPAACLWSVFAWLTMGVVIVTLVTAMSALTMIRLVAETHGDPTPQWLEELLSEEDSARLAVIGRSSMWLDIILHWPIVTPFVWLLRLCAFRRVRQQLPTFLASRVILTGAGSLTPDGTLHLSEKAAEIRRVMRTNVLPGNRPMLDTGNLVKDLLCPVRLAFIPLARLFRRRQRLQLGLSDSNMAHPAELLKVGSTCLVLDMLEAGLLEDAPQVADPIQAVHTLSADSSLQASVLLIDGSQMTALELQRFYLDRARRFLRESDRASIEAHDIVRLWGEALDSLDRDPSELVGRLDWPTKRFLLDALPADASYDTRKKMDLRYHELATGYFAQLEAAGQTVRLVSEEEARAAQRRPPEDSPAVLRGRLVRTLARSPIKLRVSWDAAGVGGRLVLLDAYRERRRRRTTDPEAR